MLGERGIWLGPKLLFLPQIRAVDWLQRFLRLGFNFRVIFLDLIPGLIFAAVNFTVVVTFNLPTRRNFLSPLAVVNQTTPARSRLFRACVGDYGVGVAVPQAVLTLEPGDRFHVLFVGVHPGQFKPVLDRLAVLLLDRGKI